MKREIIRTTFAPKAKHTLQLTITGILIAAILVSGLVFYFPCKGAKFFKNKGAITIMVMKDVYENSTFSFETKEYKLDMESDAYQSIHTMIEMESYHRTLLGLFDHIPHFSSTSDIEYICVIEDNAQIYIYPNDGLVRCISYDQEANCTDSTYKFGYWGKKEETSLCNNILDTLESCGCTPTSTMNN